MAKSKSLPRIKSWANAHLFPRQYEKIDPESMTIQGEAYSVKELLLRANQGIIAQGRKDVMYDESDDPDDIDYLRLNDTLDMSDITDERIRLEGELDEAEAREKDAKSIKEKGDKVTHKEKSQQSNDERNEDGESEKNEEV